MESAGLHTTEGTDKLPVLLKYIQIKSLESPLPDLNEALCMIQVIFLVFVFVDIVFRNFSIFSINAVFKRFSSGQLIEMSA